MIQRREIGKDLILALGYNYFFAYHKTNKQTKTKKRKRKEKSRQDFKQVRVELLRRSDLIGNDHTGRLPVTSPPGRLATSELATKERSRHQRARHQAKFAGGESAWWRGN